MSGDQQFWQSWARGIHRWGLTHLVAAFLESAGPFTLLGAQFLYISQPILQPIDQHSQATALASMLEDPGLTQRFIKFLREEPAP
jgi:hypothetical protein